MIIRDHRGKWLMEWRGKGLGTGLSTGNVDGVEMGMILCVEGVLALAIHQQVKRTLGVRPHSSLQYATPMEFRQQCDISSITGAKNL